ncbi:MAG: class I SAM-dependent methyltransferase family protein, partial [Candidatus Bathyarchaeia archaeon]
DPRIRTILRQDSPVGSPFRVRRLTCIAGEERTITIHREYGCRYKVDLSKVFFSPRLSYERARIAKSIRGGEYVVNMFSGVGCFSIAIARLAKPRVVYSIDISRDAYILMEENIRMNSVDYTVIPILGDARRIVESRLKGIADRVLEPLPDLAYAYLDVALKALKPEGGWIHYYNFLHIKNKGLHNEVYRVRHRIESMGGKITYIGARKVRSVGPNWIQVAIDLYISRTRGD